MTTWQCSGREVRIRQVVHWSDPKRVINDHRTMQRLLLHHRGCPIETQEKRSVTVYERDGTVRVVPVVNARICRRSNRLRGVRPGYRWGLPDKKECFICRLKRHLMYTCDTCTFRTCRGCWARIGLDCPQCRVGALPYSIGDRF